MTQSRDAQPTVGSTLRSMRRRWWPYLAAIGPGLLAANAGNDAGGIATYASAGAHYGYELLWVLVLVFIGVAVVQEMAARLGAVTGKGFADLVRENFPIRITALIMMTLLVANTGIIISEFVGIAAAAELFGVSRYIAVPVAAFLVWFFDYCRVVHARRKSADCLEYRLFGLHCLGYFG